MHKSLVAFVIGYAILSLSCGKLAAAPHAIVRPGTLGEAIVLPMRGQGGHSAGCGVPAKGNGSYLARTIRPDGIVRTYHLYVPATYDPNRPYPLVFRWHGTYGNGRSGGLDIERNSGEAAIVASPDGIVAPDGIDTGWWPANRGHDLALFDAMLAEVAHEYCVDLDRVFSYGFSAGAALTNDLACARGRVLRGVATVAGGPTTLACDRPVAAWILHDADDNAVPILYGLLSRDGALSRNACEGEPIRLDDGCLRYDGCARGHPVVFCRTEGLGHQIRGDYAPSQVWAFFQGLP